MLKVVIGKTVGRPQLVGQMNLAVNLGSHLIGIGKDPLQRLSIRDVDSTLIPFQTTSDADKVLVLLLGLLASSQASHLFYALYDITRVILIAYGDRYDVTFVDDIAEGSPPPYAFAKDGASL